MWNDATCLTKGFPFLSPLLGTPRQVLFLHCRNVPFWCHCYALSFIVSRSWWLFGSRDSTTFEYPKICTIPLSSNLYPFSSISLSPLSITMIRPPPPPPFSLSPLGSSSLVIREMFQAQMTSTGSISPSKRQRLSRHVKAAKSPFEFFKKLKMTKVCKLILAK